MIIIIMISNIKRQDSRMILSWVFVSIISNYSITAFNY